MNPAGQLGGCRDQVFLGIPNPLHVSTVLVEKAVLARAAGASVLNLHATGAEVLSCAFLFIPDNVKIFPPVMLLKRNGTGPSFPLCFSQ